MRRRFGFFGSVTIKKKQDRAEEKDTISKKKKVSYSTVILLSLFAEFAMMSLAISGGLRQWVPSIMKEVYGLNDRISIFITLFLPLVSIFSALISDWLYEKFKNFVLIIGMMFVISVLLFAVLISVMEVSWWLVMVLFVLLTVVMGGYTKSDDGTSAFVYAG